MNKLIQRLKNLPWSSLLQSVALTYLIGAIAEILLIWGVTHSEGIQRMMAILYAPPLGLLILLAAAIGIGALSIYLIEIRRSTVYLNTTSLWVLFLCLLVGLFLYKSILTPIILLSSSQVTIMGILIGVFWKGRPYWR